MIENLIIPFRCFTIMQGVTLEELAKEVEKLKKKIDHLEMQMLTKEDIIEIESFLVRMKKGELELLDFDEALKELGINENEIREEISKEIE
ncbi:MAG: hypothetical protein H0Z28_08645 [Archaeoglobus sp.]|nr:hypothetical protein [Archaeoglobus sp.]